MKRNLVVALYSHPDYYPPTLNALEYLARTFDEIYIVHRNVTGFGWEYPPNVHLMYSGNPLDTKHAEGKNQVYKILSYLRYTFLLLKTIRAKGSDWLLVYDYLPWLAIRIIKPFIPKSIKLWYHNHDVAEAQYIRKGSISWASWKSEQSLFSKLELFSLPSLERLQCFPMNKFCGQFFFLPNYPSKLLYKSFFGKQIDNNESIKLLYQGSIGPMHGLEEIISLLNYKILENSFQLILKGFISHEYKEELMQLAERNNSIDKLVFIGPTSYSEVISNAKNCHIGIGIHKKQDMMNLTLGTASNKIYEYAAAGLPVLIYDNSHFREILGSRKWVVFTDTTEKSLIASIRCIIENYTEMSYCAIKDFNEELCFEKYFEKIILKLKEIDISNEIEKITKC